MVYFSYLLLLCLIFVVRAFCSQSLAIVDNDFEVKIAVLDLLQKLTHDSGTSLQLDLRF